MVVLHQGRTPPNWPDTGALVSNIRKSLFFSKIKASLNDF